jgi:hypothetical protein
MQQEIYQQQQQYHTTTTSTSPHHSIKVAQPVATPTTMTSHSTTTTAVENPFQDPRHSQYTVNDEEDDDDDDMSSRHHSVISTGQQASHHAVQVTRAKPQILRVNTVRVNDLKRGGSVRTILTKSDEEPTALSRSNTIDVVDSTNNDKATLDGNPFQDDRFAVVDHANDDDDDDDLRPSRPTTNHSLGSTMGDGEITIFWSGQQPLASHSNQPH